MIFLKSDSLNANAESRALLAPNKAPWDGIDAQVKVVYYSSLQWTVDTSHRNIDSERDLQRYLFFHCAQRYAVWGSGISLMMQSDSKMTHPAMCLAHHESNSFSIWTYIFFSCPIYVWTVFNYIIYLYVSWLRHTAGLINQCQGQMSGTNVRDICSGSSLQLFRDKCTALPGQMFRDNCSASRSLHHTKLSETIVLVEVSNQTSTPNNGNQIMHHKDSTCESDCACSTFKRARTNMIEARYPGWRQNTSHSPCGHGGSGRAFWTWDTWTMSIEASELWTYETLVHSKLHEFAHSNSSQFEVLEQPKELNGLMSNPAIFEDFTP